MTVEENNCCRATPFSEAGTFCLSSVPGSFVFLLQELASDPNRSPAGAVYSSQSTECFPPAPPSPFSSAPGLGQLFLHSLPGRGRAVCKAGRNVWGVPAPIMSSNGARAAVGSNTLMPGMGLSAPSGTYATQFNALGLGMDFCGWEGHRGHVPGDAGSGHKGQQKRKGSMGGSWQHPTPVPLLGPRLLTLLEQQLLLSLAWAPAWHAMPLPHPHPGCCSSSPLPGYAHKQNTACPAGDGQALLADSWHPAAAAAASQVGAHGPHSSPAPAGSISEKPKGLTLPSDGLLGASTCRTWLCRAWPSCCPLRLPHAQIWVGIYTHSCSVESSEQTEGRTVWAAQPGENSLCKAFAPFEAALSSGQRGRGERATRSAS